MTKLNQFKICWSATVNKYYAVFNESLQVCGPVSRQGDRSCQTTLKLPFPGVLGHTIGCWKRPEMMLGKPDLRQSWQFWPVSKLLKGREWQEGIC